VSTSPPAAAKSIRLAQEAERKLSAAVTWWPWRASWRARLEPMNPAPPVSRIRTCEPPERPMLGSRNIVERAAESRGDCASIQGCKSATGKVAVVVQLRQVGQFVTHHKLYTSL